MKAEELHSLCNRILESDKAIRFVGIPNKIGKQIVSSYRVGLVPLLIPQEIECSLYTHYTVRIEDEYKKRF